MENRGGGGAAAPTGCYKCGRPGHWSRDCPSNPNPNPNSDPINDSSNSFKAGASTGLPKPPFQNSNPTEKPKKVPKKRPKLTPELLLSDDGLGSVLRHFPRSFKYNGRGHEVSDLGNLLGLYADWHRRLIPYYSFNQFVHKVEQVGASKRVKLCIRDLQDRVGNGGDPTKLRESTPEQDDLNHQQDANTAIDPEEPTPVQQDEIFQNQDIADNLPDELLNEIYQKATTEEEPSSEVNMNNKSHESSPPGNSEKQVPSTKQNPNNSTSIQFNDEQKARIEANRLKALERAAARLRSNPST